MENVHKLLAKLAESRESEQSEERNEEWPRRREERKRAESQRRSQEEAEACDEVVKCSEVVAGLDSSLIDDGRLRQQVQSQFQDQIARLAKEAAEERHQRQQMQANFQAQLQGLQAGMTEERRERQQIDSQLNTQVQGVIAELEAITLRVHKIESPPEDVKVSSVQAEDSTHQLEHTKSSHSLGHDKSAIIAEQKLRRFGLKHAKYELQESLWDACFLQFFLNSHLDAGRIFPLYILNLSLQAAMVVLVWLNLSTNEWITEQDVWSLIKWRVLDAQDMYYYHKSSQTSLATRICNQDYTILLASEQYDTFGGLQQYKISNFPFNGPMLCIISLIIWLLAIITELMSVADFVNAVFSLRCRTEKILNWQGDEDDISFSINQISYLIRFGSVFFIVIPRAAIAVFLCLAGLFYLSRDDSMGDLVLNAMALGFVLSMDELIYPLVPRRTRWILSATEAIPLNTLRSGGTWGGLFSTLWLLEIVPVVVVMHIFILGPQYERLDAAGAILCGGQKRMVFTQDKSNNIVLYAKTAPTIEKAQHEFRKQLQECNYQVCSIAQTIGLLDLPELQSRLAGVIRPNTTLAQQVDIVETAGAIMMSPPDAVESQLCVDVDYSEPARAALKYAIGVDRCSMIDGKDARGRCNEASVRRFCPQTCYCATVSFFYNISGCPPSCRTEYQNSLRNYMTQQAIANGGCQDASDQFPVPETMPYQGGNLTLFSSHIPQELLQSGKLDVQGNFGSATSNRLARLSSKRCLFKTRSLPIPAVVAEAHADSEPRGFSAPSNGNACLALAFISLIFDLGLCDFDKRFGNGLGNIAAFCPVACQLCSHSLALLDEDTADEEVSFEHVFNLTNQDAYHVQPYLESFISCGYEMIFCGERLVTFDKYYRFLGQQHITYRFKLKAGSMWLSLYDEFMSKPPLRTTKHMWLSTELYWTVTKSGYYHVVVDGPEKVAGNFSLSMATNASQCIPPQLISCDSVTNTSTNKQSSITYTKSPAKIFKFWAATGVEYSIESCSCRDHDLMVFDYYFRYPPLADLKSPSSSNMSAWFVDDYGHSDGDACGDADGDSDGWDGGYDGDGDASVTNGGNGINAGSGGWRRLASSGDDGSGSVECRRHLSVKMRFDTEGEHHIVVAGQLNVGIINFVLTVNCTS